MKGDFIPHDALGLIRLQFPAPSLLVTQ